MKKAIMKKSYQRDKPSLLLLLLLLFFVSCNGQVKTNEPAESPDKYQLEPKSIAGEPKITKTQRSNEHDNVHCGLQDRKGNLWFGTTGEGVYRFDGNLFTQFTTNDGLNSNAVYSMLEDNAGNIWLGTERGICRYDGKTFINMPIVVSNASTFNHLTPTNNTVSAKNEVRSIVQDRSGIIWFGTNDGLFCYNGTSFSRFLDNYSIINGNGLQLNWVQCILEDKKGNMWFGSGPLAMEGVCRYDGTSLTSSKPNGDGWIRYMLEDKKGNIWFSGRSHGVFRYDGKAFANFTGKDGLIANGSGVLLEDRNGNIWFGGGEKLSTVESDGGIWCYNPSSAIEPVYDSFKNYSTKDGLCKYSVWCMVEDGDGNIWIGTRNTGLYKFDGKTFTSFSE